MTAPYASPGPVFANQQARAGWADQVSVDLSFLAGQVAFKGSITSGTAIAIGNVDYTNWVIEDSQSGWDSLTKSYIVQQAGRYWVNAQTKWNGTPPGGFATCSININGVLAAVSPNASLVAFGGCSLTTILRFAVNDQVVQHASDAYTTQPDAGPADNNFLELVWMGE